MRVIVLPHLKCFLSFWTLLLKKQDETLSLYPHEWLTQWFLSEDCWSHESSQGFPFWQTFPGWKGKPCIFTIKSLHPPKCSRLATTVWCICQPACMCRQYLWLLSVFNFVCVCIYTKFRGQPIEIGSLLPLWIPGIRLLISLGIASSFWTMSLALLLFLNIICSQWVKLGHLVCAFLVSGKTAVFSWSHVVGCRRMWSTCEGRARYNCLFV